jgi:hypothetical protein
MIEDHIRLCYWVGVEQREREREREKERVDHFVEDDGYVKV